jgi:hypothetical protein
MTGLQHLLTNMLLGGITALLACIFGALLDIRDQLRKR